MNATLPQVSGPRSSPASHNPLRTSFWLGDFDPRPLALFRIAIGLVVLHDLFDLTRDFRAFLTDDGLLPRSVPRDWYAWSLFDLAGSPGAVAAIYAFGVVALVAFTLGLWTRLATIVAWVWIVSLHNRNPFITDGGDALVGILFFWSIFADLGACWSLDALRGGRRVRVDVFALRLLQAHVAVLYYATAKIKFQKGWLHGTAIYQVLQLDGFVRPIGVWVGSHPTLCFLSTYTVLLMEAAFPFCAFWPWAIRPSRATAVVLGILIQSGIALTMRVGVFQEAMLATCVLFVLPEWFDAAEAWARRQGVWTQDPKRPPSADRPESRSPFRCFAHAALAVQFALASWGNIGERRFPPPKVLRDERALLSVVQPADLFGSAYAVPHWAAPGTLSDGSSVEVLSVVAPGARPLAPAVRFSRWAKLRFKSALPWPTLGPYMCRAYDERSGKSYPGRHLASFDVIDDEIQPRLPGQEAAPAERRLLWHQDCLP